jgi:hypothetical protein
MIWDLSRIGDEQVGFAGPWFCKALGFAALNWVLQLGFAALNT